jgi:miniconductance mechanosensitive channel
LFTKHIVIHSLYRLFKRTAVTWDDGLADLKVFDNLAHILPAIVVEVFATTIFLDFDEFLPLIIN